MSAKLSLLTAVIGLLDAILQLANTILSQVDEMPGHVSTRPGFLSCWPRALACVGVGLQPGWHNPDSEAFELVVEVHNRPVLDWQARDGSPVDMDHWQRAAPFQFVATVSPPTAHSPNVRRVPDVSGRIQSSMKMESIQWLTETAGISGHIEMPRGILSNDFSS